MLLYGFDENQEFTYAFASDLMSDALALVNEYCEETVLITRLCNAPMHPTQICWM